MVSVKNWRTRCVAVLAALLSASATAGTKADAKSRWLAELPARADGADLELVVKGKGNPVVVSSPEIKEPVAVRYAFSMNPDGANLYNREGLPASPFRTDD